MISGNTAYADVHCILVRRRKKMPTKVLFQRCNGGNMVLSVRLSV